MTVLLEFDVRVYPLAAVQAAAAACAGEARLSVRPGERTIAVEARLPPSCDARTFEGEFGNYVLAEMQR